MSRGNPRHGTQARYKAGCHCAPCTEAARRASNLYKLQRLAHGPRHIPLVGTRRRVLALGVLGWTHAVIAEHAGITKRQVQRIAAADIQTVHVNTAAAVRAAYDALSMTLPPAPITRAEKVGLALVKRAARLNGGHPPLAWDDDAIDDPAAAPDLGHQRLGRGGGRPAEYVIEDIEWVLDGDPTATTSQVAHRLGMTVHAIQKALSPKRGNRPDLLDTLARNAELAGITGGRHNTRRTAA